MMPIALSPGPQVSRHYYVINTKLLSQHPCWYKCPASQPKTSFQCVNFLYFLVYFIQIYLKAKFASKWLIKVMLSPRGWI